MGDGVHQASNRFVLRHEIGTRPEEREKHVNAKTRRKKEDNRITGSAVPVVKVVLQKMSFRA